MISLGAIILDDNLLLEGVLSTSKIAMSVRPTFGAPVVQQCARSAGDSLELVSFRNGLDVYAFYTRAQLDAIAVLRDTGDPVEFVHHLLIYQVVIPPIALDEISMVDDITDPCGNEWYTGKIPLITI